jgi:hypothetical protein
LSRPRRLPRASGASRGGRAVVEVVELRGADIVEKLGDLEFRGGLFLGGQFLDRLARGLKLGLFGRAGDVQDDVHVDLGVQVHVHGVQAQFLDRTAERDLLAVEVKPSSVAASAASRVVTEP